LHTLMTSYRLYYNHGLLKDTALAGLGFDEVRFKRPLRPNDTIQVVTTITEKRPTRKPDRGIVCLRIETINQEDQLVMSMSLSALVATRGSAQTAIASSAFGSPTQCLPSLDPEKS
jgi:acyl dehydratase